MWIKIIIAPGIAVITSGAAAIAQTPSAAPNMDYFYSGSYQAGVTGGDTTGTTGTTGTQGIVGNPNCPQPVEPGGIRPLNWSCPTGTQAVGNNLLAGGLNQNQRGAPVRNAQRQAQQRQNSQLTPGQRAMLRRNSGRVRTANTQTGNTGGGSAVNQQLQSAFAQRNSLSNTQLIHGAARATGQRTFNYEHPNSAWGTGFGYGIPARNSANRGYGRGQFGRH